MTCPKCGFASNYMTLCPNCGDILSLRTEPTPPEPVRVQRACSASAVVGDGERLDYLERNPQVLCHCTWVNANRGRIFTMGCEFDPTIGDCHTTLRAAIDRALAAEREAQTQNEQSSATSGPGGVQ